MDLRATPWEEVGTEVPHSTQRLQILLKVDVTIFRRHSPFPTGAGFLEPVACNQLVALEERVDTIPNPLFWADGICGGVEDFLGFDMCRFVIFG